MSQLSNETIIELIKRNLLDRSSANKDVQVLIEHIVKARKKTLFSPLDMDIEINKVDKYVTVNNSGGNIHVTLPANVGFDLKLRAERIHLENMQNFNGNKEEHKVDGKINGGGVPVNIQTSGSVTVALN